MPLGCLTHLPTIGVAKSILLGQHGKLAQRAGSTARLIDPVSSETLGMALRTATGVKPVYVSQGHRISLAHAVKLTMTVADGYRVPRPTRDADHFVNTVRRERKESSGASRRS